MDFNNHNFEAIHEHWIRLRITLLAFYHDGMVMQADHDERLIWGLMNYLLDPVLVTVSSDLEGLAHHQGIYLQKFIAR